MQPIIAVRPAAAAFRWHGYDFGLIERSGRTAIYSQSHGTKLFAYEAVIIRLQHAPPSVRGSARNGEVVPKAERYPSDGDWGRYGWTYSLFGGQVPAESALGHRAKLATLLEDDGNIHGGRLAFQRWGRAL